MVRSESRPQGRSQRFAPRRILLSTTYALKQSPQGFTTLIAAIVFLSGVQMVFLGVIGEYLGRVYEEVKGRPLYIVSSVVRGGKWTESTYKSTASSTSVIGSGAPARSSAST